MIWSVLILVVLNVLLLPVFGILFMTLIMGLANEAWANNPFAILASFVVALLVFSLPSLIGSYVLGSVFHMQGTKSAFWITEALLVCGFVWFLVQA